MESFTNHEYFMMKAINEALIGASVGEIPIGAIIVKDNNIIASGYNRKESLIDPTSHAEIEVIRKASQILGDWRLIDCTLYVTAEPCVMCAGAILHARISKVYFGVKEPKFGGVCSNISIFNIDSFNHKVEWMSGILENEISNMMKSFFKPIRNENIKHKAEKG